MTMPDFLHYIRTHPLLTGVMATALILCAIYYATYAQASEEAGAGQSAPEVEVETVQPERLRAWNSFSGRLSAVEYVEIRPQVGGAITRILFEEGSVVEKDAPLFVIDPRPYKAEVARAKSLLSAAQSQAQLARAERDRLKTLVAKQVVSQSRYDAAQNDYKRAVASVSGAKATLDQAVLDYEYAHIKAPIAGRVGRAEITVGNIVEAGSNAPILTTIVAHDKLYAEFDVDEQTYIQSARQSGTEPMPVQLTLAGHAGKTYEGVLSAFDNQLDAASGTIRARAVFENKDGVLVPGMYADIKLGSADRHAVLMVNEKAIGTDQAKKFVYVVTPDNTIAYREVTLGRALEGRREVVSGLTSGESVLVNGLQRVRPGMPVKPVEVGQAKEGVQLGS